MLPVVVLQGGKGGVNGKFPRQSTAIAVLIYQGIIDLQRQVFRTFTIFLPFNKFFSTAGMSCSYPLLLLPPPPPTPPPVPATVDLNLPPPPPPQSAFLPLTQEGTTIGDFLVANRKTEVP